MLFKSVVLSYLATFIFALEQHQHHQHDKRAVKVVTETNVVTVTLGNGKTTAVAAADPAAATTAAEKEEAEAHTEAANTPTTLEVATSTPTTGSDDEDEEDDKDSSSSSSSSFGAGAKAITYTPYSDDGGCKSSDQISKEVKSLSGYEMIRIYGVDCNQAEAVLSNLGDGQKLFAGIHDVYNIESGVKTLSSAVEKNGGWDKVDTVSIGNELVNSGQADSGQISKYVDQGRSALKSAGYDGKVVSVDTFIAVINNPSLCDSSDYMAVNAHAFFDGNVEAKDSGDWVLKQIQRVYSACGGKKDVLITETGWPSKGDSNNKAVPSSENQKAAIDSIKKSCGKSSTLFTAFNDMWKQPGPFKAEQFWGIDN